MQGVGFRYAVKSLGPGYDVLGTIRNLADGRVELVAEGERAELEEFLQAVRGSGCGVIFRTRTSFGRKRRINLEGLRLPGDTRLFE